MNEAKTSRSELKAKRAEYVIQLQAGTLERPWVEPLPVPPAMRPEAIMARIRDMQTAGIKGHQMAVESGVPRAELEAWIKGERKEETTDLLSDWIEGIDEELTSKSKDLVRTPTTVRILSAFEKAREPKGRDGRRGIAAVYGASGTGKTAAAQWLEGVDKGVVHIQVGDERTFIKIVLTIIAKRNKYGVAHRNESAMEILLQHFGPGDLIILDHAHLIRTSVIEQLTVFPDTHGIAIALLGNLDGYKKLVDMKTKQIMSRIGGALVHIAIPSEEDVDAVLEAEGITGRKEREFCAIIGCQDGGMRYLYETLWEARKLQRAAGSSRLDVRYLKLGAANAGYWGAEA